ncbi:MAG: fumarylacetoacetate hydrolase family protein [Candidatus Magnetomorum sp.]|nr:fumarylacetoacetate hydrolase family protein [Candidatus Magnetomorum sp.]
MKLAQIKYQNQLLIAEVFDNKVFPFDFHGDMIDLIKRDQSLPEKKHPGIDMDAVEFFPPVLRPSKIIAIGLNYRDHATELKVKIPESPLVFTKFSNSLIGHNQPVCWDDQITQKVDFEAELAIIIKKESYRCPPEKAVDAIWGYTCANDISARDLQFGDGQWVRGKSLNTFCPLGPWVVLGDTIPDPNALDIQCRVNDKIMQHANTNQMIFPIPELVAFLSDHFTLYPGDVILTGTPSGVGVFHSPPIFLKHGDRVIVDIESIGQLHNICQTNHHH